MESAVLLKTLWMTLSVIRFAASTCTLPSTWDGTWYDSSMSGSNIVFNHATSAVTSGWVVTAYASTVTSWTCQDHDTSNNFLLFKGDQFVNLFSSSQNAFRCIKYTKVTDYSYIYYIYASIEVNANDARVHIESYNPAVTSWSTASYCTATDLSPEEYVVLVKDGYTTSVKQYFPTPFLISATYTHNDGSSTTCGSNSDWDICSDRYQVVVNYTRCATRQFYSSGGNGYCVYSTNSGNVYYVTVINNDTSPDFSTTFRFTCYAVEMSGSTVYASDSKGTCERSQSPTVKASDGTGTLVFTPYITCPFTSSSETAAASSSLVIIIAIVVVLLLLIAAFIIACLLCKKYKAKQKTGDKDDKRDYQEGMSIEGLTPRDAVAINPPEKTQLDPIPQKVQDNQAHLTERPLPPISKAHG